MPLPDILGFHSAARARRRDQPRWALAGRGPIGALLTARGALDPGDLARALALQAREDVPLGEILLAHGMVAEADLFAAMSDQWGARQVDPLEDPPDPRLIDRVGAETCLRHRLLPWRRIGAVTVVVTSRPEDFPRQADDLAATLGEVVMALASERAILEALVALRARRLVRRAETMVPAPQSSRLWDGRRFRARILAVAAVLALAMALAPVATFAALTGLALLALAANTGLRIGALATRAPAALRRPEAAPPAIARLPVVSVMVPLFREREIAARLVRRLSRLSYPRELLDIVLVTEAEDATTRAALEAARLPRWMRVVTVPDGPLRTKPRALNYALGFCHGSIIGVYDAEDAPDADQIHKVVARFHSRGPEVACLQGVLDFYNARANFMARSFALEYAAWFRVVLPGLQRMGLAIPLGGTTLFFRRQVLEDLGGWDAHNVTEDADLGIRLARRGYRTELLDSVTAEEATARPWPWVRQRSRWLKGYAMTWAVHMRDPVALWRELGPWRFFGVQALFGGTLAQFLLAPVLWSYWLLLFDLPHPLSGALPGWVAVVLVLTFLASMAVDLAVMMLATVDRQHRHLRPWVLTLGLYFPLATLAAAKGLAEMVARPFYWDKTAHGQDPAEGPDG